MADQNDSDSDWDSTLDFTSPRQTGISQPPRIDIEIEDEEFSRHDSMAEPKPTPAERFSVAINNKKNMDERNRSSRSNTPVPEVKEPPLYATVQKDSRGKVVETKLEDSPPYNFRQALTGNMTPDEQREQQRPGKDRKGNIYDVAKPEEPRQPVNKHDSFRSVNSWDSDADEKTLQELRVNFSAEKKREAEVESMKLQLQNQDPLYDDPMATNRSETTWKSFTSGFGEKIARLSGRGPKGSKDKSKNQNENSQKQQRLEQGRQPQPLPAPEKLIPSKAADMFRVTTAKPEEVVVEEGVEGDLRMFQSYSTSIHPPYITKEEEGGWTYYFGHSDSMQQYDAEDDAEQAFMPRIAEKVERVLKRIYQEFFGAIRILTSIAIILIVELLNFVLKHILQPLIVGILGTLGEFFCKPLLSILFNGFVQPFGIFLWNAAVSFRHMFGPIGDILRRILKEFAMCCRSIKPIQIHYKTGTQPELQNV